MDFLHFGTWNTRKIPRRASRAGVLDSPKDFLHFGTWDTQNFPGALRAPVCLLPGVRHRNPETTSYTNLRSGISVTGIRELLLIVRVTLLLHPGPGPGADLFHFFYFLFRILNRNE